jgi:hypothetical protein
MRGVVTVLLQILAAAVGIAALGGLVAMLVAHFAHWGGAVNGLGWGMIATGAIVGFAAGGSGSPSENLARGRLGAFGTYWGQSAPLPQSPLQLALGGLLAFGGGVAVLILFVY